MSTQTLNSRVYTKMKKIRKDLPNCRDEATIRRLATAEAEADIWRELYMYMGEKEAEVQEFISLNFKDFRSDLYIIFRNEGEEKARLELEQWLANKGWAEKREENEDQPD